MHLAAIFAVLSGIVVIIGGPPYLYDILKGRTKPERTTWFIWTVLGSIAFVTQVQLGAHWSLLFAGLNVAGNLAVFLLSIKFGVGGWKRIDIAALLIACVGLVLSFVTRSPLVALWGVIVADAAGTVPTLYKTYLMPKSETTITWLALGTSSLLAIFSVGSWKFSLLLYPVYITLSNYIVVAAQIAGTPRKARKRTISFLAGR
jgi:hypothetical protein